MNKLLLNIKKCVIPIYWLGIEGMCYFIASFTSTSWKTGDLYLLQGAEEEEEKNKGQRLKYILESMIIG